MGVLRTRWCPKRRNSERRSICTSSPSTRMRSSSAIAVESASSIACPYVALGTAQHPPSPCRPQRTGHLGASLLLGHGSLRGAEPAPRQGQRVLPATEPAEHRGADGLRDASGRHSRTGRPAPGPLHTPASIGATSAVSARASLADVQQRPQVWLCAHRPPPATRVAHRAGRDQ